MCRWAPAQHTRSQDRISPEKRFFHRSEKGTSKRDIHQSHLRHKNPPTRLVAVASLEHPGVCVGRQVPVACFVHDWLLYRYRHRARATPLQLRCCRKIRHTQTWSGEILRTIIHAYHVPKEDLDLQSPRQWAFPCHCGASLELFWRHCADRLRKTGVMHRGPVLQQNS